MSLKSCGGSGFVSMGSGLVVTGSGCGSISLTDSVMTGSVADAAWEFPELLIAIIAAIIANKIPTKINNPLTLFFIITPFYLSIILYSPKKQPPPGMDLLWENHNIHGSFVGEPCTQGRHSE